MNSVRVSGLGGRRTLEELKAYFGTPRNGGGRIRKIYYPLMNNDAVIVFEEEDVASQILSVRDHDVFGDEVQVIPLPVNVFTEIQAELDPGVASMIKATQRCEDYLKYICEVEMVSYDGQNLKLKGDIYQIEMAWKVICHYLDQQHQIHSKMKGSTEKTRKEKRKHFEKGILAVSSDRARRRQREEESKKFSLPVSEDEHKANIDRIIRQTLEDSANRSKNSSSKSNDSLSKYDVGYEELVDVPSTSGVSSYSVKKMPGYAHDNLSLDGRNKEISQNQLNSSRSGKTEV